MPIEFLNQTIDFSDLMTAAIGGVIGALAGGVPAYVIARRQARDVFERDAATQTRDEKAAGLTAAVKLIQIGNSLIGLRKHVEACFQVTAAEAERMEPWQRLITMVGFTDEATIRFSDKEITLFARAKESQLMQDLLLLANRHASAMESWRIYCERRDAMNERAPKPTRFEGERGSTILTEEQAMALKVYTIPLNNLALGLRESLAENMAMARDVTSRFNPALSKYFKIESFATLDFPSDGAFEELVNNEAVQKVRS